MPHSRKTAALAAVAIAALLASCASPQAEQSGGSAAGTAGLVSGDLNTVNTAEVQTDTGEMVFAIEKTITNWNTLTAAGDISEGVWVTNALYPSVFVIQPDASTIEMNTDLMESAEVVGQDPTVVEYVINPDAVWSDGVPITGDDFIYQWQALNTRDCPDCSTHDTDGLDKVASIDQSEDGKTVTVTYDSNYSEWQRPFGRLLPAHIAAEQGDVYTSFSEYFVDTVPTFSGGPFIITDFEEGVSITLEPNPEWYGEGPNLQKLTFRMITDTQQTPIALQNKEIQAMYPQPQVDLMTQVQDMEQLGVAYQTNQSMVMEALMFNHSNSFLADPVLREAIATAVNSQEVIDKTVGQFSETVTPLGSVMIMQQQAGYENKTDAYGYGSGDLEAAKALLEEAGYTVSDGALIAPSGEPVPPLRAVYSVGNAVRESTMQIVAAAADQLGITLALETTDALGDSLAESSPYGYDLLVVGFTGSPFLASNAFKRFTTGTGYNLNYSSPEVDALVDEALAATSQDEAVELINEADDIVVRDLLMMPLYQKPSLLAYYSEYGNIRDNPTISGPSYNMSQWGLIAQ
jgi:peptide/nickel transport system substrate-binding protein